jgi:hypothetical protein
MLDASHGAIPNGTIEASSLVRRIQAAEQTLSPPSIVFVAATK